MLNLKPGKRALVEEENGSREFWRAFGTAV